MNYLLSMVLGTKQLLGGGGSSMGPGFDNERGGAKGPLFFFLFFLAKSP